MKRAKRSVARINVKLHRNTGGDGFTPRRDAWRSATIDASYRGKPYAIGDKVRAGFAAGWWITEIKPSATQPIDPPCARS